MVHPDLLCQALRNSVAHSEVLESEVAEVLQVTAVDLAELATGGLICTWPREVCIRMFLGPAHLGVEVARDE